MKIIKNFLVVLIILLNLNLLISQTASVYSSSINPQFTDPRYDGYNNYLTSEYEFDNSQCVIGEDVIVQIIPDSCTPNIIRSDLLEEQNVPVFCKVRLIKINPLIDVSTIKSLHFKGNYPQGISGVSYFPARAAIQKDKNSNIPNLLDSPVNEDLGYLAIIISRQSSELTMPDFIEGEITATIDYGNEGIFGVGNTNLYINEMDDYGWAEKSQDNMIWNGKAYIRGESIDDKEATFQIYDSLNNFQNSILLKEGQTSGDIYLDGYYCSAGMRIKLEKISAPVNSALIQINDEQTWVSEGDKFLDDKCRVVSLNTYSGGGKINVVCSAKNGSFELSLNPSSAEFILENGESKKVAMNQKIDSQNNIYLSYVGQDKNNVKYAVVIQDSISKSEKEFLDKKTYETIEKFVQGNNYLVEELKSEIKSIVRNQYKSVKENNEINVIVLSEGDSYSNFELKSVFVTSDKNWDVEETSEKDLLSKDYYDKAIEKYEDLVDFYPNEKSPDGDAYAAIGLFEAAKLSKQFEMNAKSLEFFNRLIIDYPNSNVAKNAKRDGQLVIKYDSSKSKTNLVINNQQYFIDLLDFKEPKKEESSAELLIDGKVKMLSLNEIVDLGNENLDKSVTLKKLESEVISIEYKKGKDAKNYVLDLNRQREINLDDVSIRLEKINLKKQAKISILPSSKGTRTESSFFFRVYIEKRAIPLSPEMAQRMADSLVNVIQRLEQIKEVLGNVIRVMKSVCFTTSTLLSTQNMINGANENSIARTNIMTGAGGWNDKCEQLVNDGKYPNLQKCLIENSEDVEKDIEIYSNEIKKTNSIIKNLNNEDVEKEFEKEFNEWCKSQKGNIKLPDKDGNSVGFEGERGICSWDSLTHEQRTEIMTLYNIQNSGSSTLKEVTGNQLGKIVLNAKNYEDNSDNSINPNEKENDENLGIRITNPIGDQIIYGDIKIITSTDEKNNVYNNFNKGSKVIRVFIPKKKIFSEKEVFVAHEEVAGKEVVVELIKIDNSDGEYRTGGKIISALGSVLSEAATDSVEKYLSLSGINRIKQTDEKNYNNPIKNPDKIKIKYFEKAPYKGLPSEVVFDVENGWYVEASYISSGFGQPYEESGKIINFYICNAGTNGLIEFKKNGDDICRYYNEKTGASVDFPGLSSSKSKALVERAQKAINDATSQYGKDKILINGRNFESGVSFGGESGRCTDFMSVEDCNVLFNVCDPIICPSSRCNLGGEYQVDNVVETGIVGSLVLCLPNYKEGVMVPICLTGVHAGLEGYISILKSTVDCLREGAASGRSIGICDEIRSVYICELFWKNSEQFIGRLIPQIKSDVFVSVRGGGEYANINTAWGNTQGSVNSFMANYNSNQGFQSLSTENIGSGFCSSFMSQTVPNSESGSNSVFERLTEPYSPPQYHAWFSENPMTTVTVPATSHYKVYFHIYAGSNKGASYSVYLRDLPSLSNSINSYLVDRGYISENGQVDKAKDFTAPSGFRQLCIIVNGQENCDFGQVSTSFAVDNLNEAYVSEQINQEINSEEECVAGTPSYIDMDPNPFRGSENIDLYEKGIIRVCATENPGKQDLSEKYDTTNSSSERWREVGNCGDKTMKCWLDTNSVKEVIKNKDIANAMLGELTIEEVLSDINYLTGTESSTLANKIENKINEVIINEDFEAEINKIIEDLNLLIEKGSNNIYRARGLYLFGKLYKKVAQNLLGVYNSEELIAQDSYEDLHSGTSTEERVIQDTYEDLHSGDIITNDESEKIILRENVNIILKTTLGNQIIYKYKEGRWLSSDDSYFVESSKEQNWDYLQGVKKIVEKTDFTEEIIINEKVIENKIDESDEMMVDKILNELREN